MNRLHRLLLFHDPKAGMPTLEEARRVARVVAPQRIVERLQRLEIKFLGFFIIADWNGYVFNHAPNIRDVGAISIAKCHPYTSRNTPVIERLSWSRTYDGFLIWVRAACSSYHHPERREGSCTFRHGLRSRRPFGRPGGSYVLTQLVGPATADEILTSELRGLTSVSTHAMMCQNWGYAHGLLRESLRNP